MKQFLKGVPDILFAALVIVAVIVTVTYAQDKPAAPAAKPAPAAVAVKADPLSEIENRDVVIALGKIKEAQAVLENAQLKFQILMTGLQKPGYQIQQIAEGKYGYVPEPKKEKD